MFTAFATAFATASVTASVTASATASVTASVTAFAQQQVIESTAINNYGLTPPNTIIFSLDKYKTKTSPFKEWISYITDTLIQKEKEKVDSLNQDIIDTTNALLNMCDKMIPLSSSDKKEGFLSYFSATTQAVDLYAYRAANNNRELFLCDDTFESPPTLLYDSETNALSFTYDPNKINYYIIVLQNIIDNDKGKTKSLVEKAKYILPILQKFERQLPTYLELTSKRSITVDDYFKNLKRFWENILEHANIGAHESPFKFKNELIEKEALRAKHKAELFEAEEEANRIIHEFHIKQRIEDAHNYIREQKIMQDDKKFNYSNIEWSRYKNKIKQRVMDFTDVFIYGINGLLKSPVDFIVNFTSDTILDIGMVAFMLLFLISICSYICKKIVSIFYTF